MLRFQSDNKVMMEARSEDLRIIWDAMLEGSRFVVDIKDVVTEIEVGLTKEFCKGSGDAENKKKWKGLLNCWEAANVQVPDFPALFLATLVALHFTPVNQ